MKYFAFFLSFALFAASCSKKSDFGRSNRAQLPTISKEITVELLAGENYSYSLPMTNTNDNYNFTLNSAIAAKSTIDNNVFNYTAPASIATSGDEIVLTNEHPHTSTIEKDEDDEKMDDHPCSKGGNEIDGEHGPDQHYIVKVHIKLVTVKTK